MSNWISVDERLPENATPVIAFYSGEVGIAYYFTKSEYWNFVYFGSQGVEKFVEITHWQPLPQPPQADDIPDKFC